MTRTEGIRLTLRAIMELGVVVGFASCRLPPVWARRRMAPAIRRAGFIGPGGRGALRRRPTLPGMGPSRVVRLLSSAGLRDGRSSLEAAFLEAAPLRWATAASFHLFGSSIEAMLIPCACSPRRDRVQWSGPSGWGWRCCCRSGPPALGPWIPHVRITERVPRLMPGTPITPRIPARSPALTIVIASVHATASRRGHRPSCQSTTPGLRRAPCRQILPARGPHGAQPRTSARSRTHHRSPDLNFA